MTKKILFIPTDSKGPQFGNLQIAKRLVGLGHDVRIYLTAEMKHLVDEYGFQEHAWLSPVNIQILTKGSAMYSGSVNPIKLLSEGRGLFEALSPPILQQLEVEVRSGMIDPAETLIAIPSSGLLFLGPALMELGFHDFYTIEPYFFVDLKGLWANQYSQIFGKQGATFVSRALFSNSADGLAGRLGFKNKSWNKLMDCIKGQIYMVSPQLALDEADESIGYFITGYPLEQSKNANIDSVKGFVDAGDSKVVLLTLGSMAITDEMREQVRCAFVDSAEAENFRLILVGFEGQSTQDVLYHPGFLPYVDSLPLVDLIVSHCGSGTTHEMLRSGTPILSLPMLGDQPYWAKVLSDQGLTVGSMQLGKLSVQGLRTAFQYLKVNSKVTIRAEESGVRMNTAGNDGITNVSRILANAANNV